MRTRVHNFLIICLNCQIIPKGLIMSADAKGITLTCSNCGASQLFSFSKGKKNEDSRVSGK